MKGVLREQIWVESNDQKDAARALEMLHVQLISAVIDPYSWKWVFVTLHHALRAFLVASETTDRDPSAPEQVAGDLLEIQDRHQEPGVGPCADDLQELYQRMKARTGFQSGENADLDIERMLAYRNAFIHRLPARWKLKINELPSIAAHCLDVIDFLGWNPGHVRWRKEAFADLARVKSMASRRVLEALERQYQGL
jgi:hypothetical protein